MDTRDSIANGAELGLFLRHHNLSKQVATFLQDMGAEVVGDLDFICTDKELVAKAQKELSSKDYNELSRAYKVQQREHLYEDSWTAVSDQKYSSPSNAAQSITTEKKLGELTKRLNALHTDPKDTELRIKELEIQIKQLEEVSGIQKEKNAKLEKVVKQRLEESKAKKQLIEVMKEQLQHAASLDLAVMLDCTGSMCSYITAAKNQIREFVASIGSVYPDIPLRLAFLPYRDIFDPLPPVHPFSSSVEDFQAVVARTGAHGGATLTHTIEALHSATKLQWSSNIRILYHIGDMPCRGKQYNDFHSAEVQPDGDPQGRDPILFLRSLYQQDVQYFFGKITPYTDKMINRFHHNLGHEYITVTPMNAGTMMKVITSSVTASLSSTLSSSSRLEDGTPKEKDVVLDPAVPNWSRIVTEKAAIYALQMPASVDDLIAETSDKSIDDFPDVAPVTVKCAPNPFAKGAVRLAYYAQEIAPTTAAPATTTNICTPIILKESLAKSKAHQTKAKYDGYLVSHRAAMALAEEFNSITPASTDRIEFVNVSLLQFLAREGQPFHIKEDQIHGTWEKFNGNNGLCAPSPTPVAGTQHETVQAYSHWTYHRCGKALMVVDCQGCYDKTNKTFRLTDPAVHCTSLLRYGSTNWGREGIRRFFKTHRCNDLCKALCLPEENSV